MSLPVYLLNSNIETPLFSVDNPYLDTVQQELKSFLKQDYNTDEVELINLSPIPSLSTKNEKVFFASYCIKRSSGIESIVIEKILVENK